MLAEFLDWFRNEDPHDLSFMVLAGSFILALWWFEPVVFLVVVAAGAFAAAIVAILYIQSHL